MQGGLRRRFSSAGEAFRMIAPDPLVLLTSATAFWFRRRVCQPPAAFKEHIPSAHCLHHAWHVVLALFISRLQQAKQTKAAPAATPGSVPQTPRERSASTRSVAEPAGAAAPVEVAITPTHTEIRQRKLSRHGSLTLDR